MLRFEKLSSLLSRKVGSQFARDNQIPNAFSFSLSFLSQEREHGICIRFFMNPHCIIYSDQRGPVQELLSTLSREQPPFSLPSISLTLATFCCLLGGSLPKFLTYYQRWDVYCRCVFPPGLFLLQFGDLRDWTHSLSLRLFCGTIPFQQIIR